MLGAHRVFWWGKGRKQEQKVVWRQKHRQWETVSWEAKRKNQTFTCAIWFSLEWLLLCVTSLTEPSWFFETICLVWFLRYFCLLSPATLYKCVSYAYLSLYPLNLYSCYLTKWNVCMIITLKHFAFHCPIQEPLVVWGCLSLGLN